MHPNMIKFLTLISHSEGTDSCGSDMSYKMLVGGKFFNSFKDHPRIMVRLNQSLVSSAAGRYQIMARNFDVYKKQLNLPDFSPESQDKIALQLIKECHATEDIEKGDIDPAIRKCASRWASFPGAGYGQHENAIQDLINFYNSL